MKWLLLALYAAKIADLGTGEMARSRGDRELNPFLQSRRVSYAVTAVGPLAVYKLSEGVRSKKARVLLCVAVVTVWSLAAYNNYRVAKRMKEPPGGNAFYSLRPRERGFRVRFTVPFN